MRLVMHLGRAALVFWVAAILVPGAVGELGSVRTPSTPETGLHHVSGTAGSGLHRLGDLTRDVQGSEDGVRRIVDRVRLETERFIAQLP
jgi:hypothetical protein